MLAAADLYPYTFEDAVRHLGRIFVVTSQGTCFIWLPSYSTGDYKRNAQTIICIPNGTPLFCRDQSSPDQNKIADPGCALHPRFGLTWNVVADFGILGSTILVVVTHGTTDVQHGHTIYHDRTVTIYPGIPFFNPLAFSFIVVLVVYFVVLVGVLFTLEDMYS